MVVTDRTVWEPLDYPVLLWGLIFFGVAACQSDAATRPMNPVASIAVPEPPLVFEVGDTITLTPVLRDAAATILSGRTVSYTSTTPAVLSVSQTGQVRALALGEGMVTIRSENETTSVTFEVSSRVTMLRALPHAVTIGVGGSATVSGTTYNSSGDARDRPITYQSSDSSVATIDAHGVVVGVAPGTVTILSMYVSRHGVVLTGSTDVTVVQVPASTFSIDIRFLGTVDPAVQTAARSAAARWSRVVIGPMQDLQLDMPASPCSPKVNETVHTLMVFVSVDSVDGSQGVLGFGGPCAFVQETLLPVLGRIVLDSSDVAQLLESGEAVDLLTHELGHVLGIGTLWQIVLGGTTVRDLTVGLGTDVPLYTGSGARAAATALGFSDDTTQPVNIENQGGPATRNSHWRADIYQPELMTGYLLQGGMPLSTITIGSLRDMGWIVTETGADPFTASPPSHIAPLTGRYARRNLHPPTAAFLGHDAIQPRFMTDRNGKVYPIR